jgi:hypothetical protein
MKTLPYLRQTMARLLRSRVTPDQFAMLLNCASANGVIRDVIHPNTSSVARVIAAGYVRQDQDRLYRLTAEGERVLFEICNKAQRPNEVEGAFQR